MCPSDYLFIFSITVNISQSQNPSIWRSDYLTILPSDYLTAWLSDKLTIWQTDYLTDYLHGRLSEYETDYLVTLSFYLPVSICDADLSPEAGGWVWDGSLVQVGLECGDGEPAGGGTRAVHRQRGDLHLVLATVLQPCNITVYNDCEGLCLLSETEQNFSLLRSWNPQNNQLRPVMK